MKTALSGLALATFCTAALAQPAGHAGHAMPAASHAMPGGDAPPVGTLPSSDGASGRRYDEYGIHPHMLDDAVTWRLGFEKFGLAQLRDDTSAAQWDGQFWIGTDRDKLVVESEGEKAAGRSAAFAQAFWSRAVSPYWDLQLGARRDFGSEAARNWAALGLAGALPYNIETQLTAYAGSSGRTALRLKAEYDFLVTQKLVFTPEVEAMAYGKADRQRETGSGLAQGSLSLQLRYEVTRRFAPYVGVSFSRKFGNTASMARDAGQSVSDRAWLMGVRFWF
ncbi:copper resistance protein B [Bordetella hinzii]|jgi:copper resistance protein B|uniref:Copper resistance protein B n=1 Tax=Bordetella hinzii TaxID=103855 RepID=A0AAN1RW62_9BORD|nr:copper resistance protein B [Bordetella hinzii]AKQ61972.1 Copper resistance protein B precursor [Bordetella hinzii]AZW17104.1 copper resistance protein B [Bordetella hinzii]KCB42197.1 copper resistance protein B CopB [Bordetella hinzii 4161]KXA70533.1 copper resistance protein [Bordetella hinzii LMG 13501]MBZ0074886.1 copper resistance protein B [Bordetella hinzii]